MYRIYHCPWGSINVNNTIITWSAHKLKNRVGGGLPELTQDNSLPAGLAWINYSEFQSLRFELNHFVLLLTFLNSIFLLSELPVFRPAANHSGASRRKIRQGVHRRLRVCLGMKARKDHFIFQRMGWETIWLNSSSSGKMAKNTFVDKTCGFLWWVHLLISSLIAALDLTSSSWVR